MRSLESPGRWQMSSTTDINTIAYANVRDEGAGGSLAQPSAGGKGRPPGGAERGLVGHAGGSLDSIYLLQPITVQMEPDTGPSGWVTVLPLRRSACNSCYRYIRVPAAASPDPPGRMTSHPPPIGMVQILYTFDRPPNAGLAARPQAPNRWAHPRFRVLLTRGNSYFGEQPLRSAALCKPTPAASR
jgi:hypothetical protein